MALSPNGRTIALGCQDHTVHVWDAADQVQVSILRGHTSWVNHVAYSPHGSRLASASADKTVKLWSTSTGRCDFTLVGHFLSVSGVAFSPDSAQLASASWDRTVCLWDVALGEVLLTLRGHTDWVHGVAWAPSGRHLASVSSDHSVRLWSGSSGKAEHALTGHLQTVKCVSFARNSALVASGSLDSTVRVWNVQDGSLTGKMDCEEGSVHCLAFVASDKIVIGCSDKRIKVWNFFTGEVEARFTGHHDVVLGICVSEDGYKMFSCSHDSTVRVWKLLTQRCVVPASPQSPRSTRAGSSTVVPPSDSKRFPGAIKNHPIFRAAQDSTLESYDDIISSLAAQKEQLEHCFRAKRQELLRIPSPRGLPVMTSSVTVPVAVTKTTAATPKLPTGNHGVAPIAMAMPISARPMSVVATPGLQRSPSVGGGAATPALSQRSGCGGALRTTSPVNLRRHFGIKPTRLAPSSLVFDPILHPPIVMEQVQPSVQPPIVMEQVAGSCSPRQVVAAPAAFVKAPSPVVIEQVASVQPPVVVEQVAGSRSPATLMKSPSPVVIEQMASVQPPIVIEQVAGSRPPRNVVAAPATAMNMQVSRSPHGSDADFFAAIHGANVASVSRLARMASATF